MSIHNPQDESEQNIRNSYEFLLEKYRKNEPITKEELQSHTNWDKPGTFDTYFGKIFKPLLKKIDNDQFLITDAFMNCSTWVKFRKHFSQTRNVRQDYKHQQFKNVVIFEFFMPLTNEAALKSALDSLFYKDTLMRRLHTISLPEIERNFTRNENETNVDYFDRICIWISDHFVGFSIGHFKGRYRVGDLMSFSEVGQIHQEAGRYIEDETTAIVKFIFPCGEIHESTPTLNNFMTDSNSSNNNRNEASLIRFFFENLFVEMILEVVNGEDEIWMLETGMRKRLHIWKVDP